MGPQAIEADELKKLESAREALETPAACLQDERARLSDLTELQDKFLANWVGLGDRLDHATAEEKRTILYHYVASIEWRAAGSGNQAGIYRLNLFPEAVEDRFPSTESGLAAPRKGDMC
jgi:hypothetical protein